MANLVIKVNGSYGTLEEKDIPNTIIEVLTRKGYKRNVGCYFEKTTFLSWHAEKPFLGWFTTGNMVSLKQATEGEITVWIISFTSANLETEVIPIAKVLKNSRLVLNSLYVPVD